MNKVRILLVDDHPLFRQGVTWTLTNQPDLEIIGEVADGQAAIQQARTPADLRTALSPFKSGLVVRPMLETLNN